MACSGQPHRGMPSLSEGLLPVGFMSCLPLTWWWRGWDMHRKTGEKKTCCLACCPPSIRPAPQNDHEWGHNPQAMLRVGTRDLLHLGSNQLGAVVGSRTVGRTG